MIIDDPGDDSGNYRVVVQQEVDQGDKEFCFRMISRDSFVLKSTLYIYRARVFGFEHLHVTPQNSTFCFGFLKSEGQGNKLTVSRWQHSSAGAQVTALGYPHA